MPAILLATLPSGRTQTVATYHDRADQALQSFLVKFWNGGQQYLRNNFPDSGSLTGYWTYANGWDALMDGVERSGGQQYSGLIESFYLGQDERGWTSGYYDDECWMTLALIRAYDLSTNADYLIQAGSLYADIETGWDTNCCGAIKGGLWWDKAHTSKATAANAGAALAGARLYQRTGNASYLNFAEKVYSFWFSKMVDPVTFQVCDHIQTDGTKVWWKFSYNEGLMIGASVALSEATENAAYLTNAHHIAGFMIAHEVVSTAYGNVLYDGDNSGCAGDCHEFKGPAYRYLTQLYATDTNKTQYYNVLKASADAIWDLARYPLSTVFAVNWAGPPQSKVDELQDSAACMALNRFAQQYSAYPGSGIPAGRYEAENGTLHHVGLEANGTDFTGWGYIAGWNGDGQWIDFRLNFATAGRRMLTFRYAAGAGDASRLIYINGAYTFPNLSFPGTGSWNTYSTVSVSDDFPAGLNKISVIYNSSLGSANFLNLDNMTVTDFRITAISAMPAATVQLKWNTVTGQTYRVQFIDQLTSGTWSNLDGIITATGATATVSDTIATNTARYYRVLWEP